MAANKGIESAMGIMAVEYDNVQKKTFTKWVNTHLINAGMKVNDLYEDFSDGIKLITLLELLTKDKLKREKGKMRVHKRLNVQVALDCLARHKVKLVGITSDSIVDGKKTLVLGMVWTLILHFQLSGGGEGGNTGEAKKELLKWAQTAVEPYDLRVNNFSRDWSDGKVFCAVLHRHRPDLLDYSGVETSPPEENLQLAFDTAHDKLGVEKLLDTEDVAVSQPDEKSILTYVSFLRQQFPEMPPARKRGPAVSPEDYKSLHSDLLKWAKDKKGKVQSRDYPKSLPEMMSVRDEFEKYLKSELPSKTHEKAFLSDMADALEASKKGDPGVLKEHPMDKLEQTWDDLLNENDACKRAIEDEIKRMQDLDALAKETKSTCEESDKKMDKLEEEMAQLSSEMDKLTPDSCKKVLSKIRQELADLASPVDKVKENSSTLDDGGYWDMDSVKPKVNDTAAKYEYLQKKLEDLEAAAQEVGGTKEKILDLLKKFQDVVKWKVGKEFEATIEQKKEFLDQANKELEDLKADPKLAKLVPEPLNVQCDIANKHWEEMLKLQVSENEAEVALRELTDLKSFSEDMVKDLLSKAPLADSLEGVKKQKEEHKEFTGVVSAKKPEVMKYAKLAVKCQSTDLLDTIKKQHASLGKQWGQLMQKQQKWGKLVTGCADAWQAGLEVEEALEDLEKWMVAWGPTADNQTVLLQQAQLQAFDKDQMTPFKEKFAEMKTAADKLASLGGHPPVSSLVERLQERFDWLNSSLEARMTGAGPACDTAQEFDQKQAPFAEWLSGASSDVKNLFPVELDREKLSKAKQALEGIQQDTRSREDEVTSIATLATTFEEQREPLVKEEYRYCGKLEALTPPVFDVSVVKGNRAPPTEESSSILDQSDALKSQWEWVLKQSVEQLDIVNDLLATVEDFEEKKKSLSDFIEEGKSKLVKEKPIAEDSAKIKEQLDTCRSYRSELGDKQAEVEGTLALGRSLLASPHTSADNHDFEEGLKDAIREWSDLQLGWEDWYRELQSASDKSAAAEQNLEDLKAWVNQAKDRTEDLFPIKPESASVRSDLETAKNSFTQDVLSPCDKQKGILEELKANLPLLKNPEEAQKIFDEFEQFAKDTDDKAQKLEDALQWADRYDQEKSPVEQALEDIERKLAESKRVPSDEGLTDLRDHLDSMEKEIQDKTRAVEELLKDLEEANSLKDIMEPDLFEKEKDNIRKRWDRVKDEIAGRSADVDAAQEKNKEYQGLKDPFTKWLGAAEGDKKKLKKVPKGRRKMKKYSDNLANFKDNVDEHEPDLEAVEEKGKEFLDAAKAHDSKLEDYKAFLSEENPTALQPTHTGSTPKRSTKDDSGACKVEQELGDLRPRYDNLKLQTNTRKEAFDGAKVKRDPVDDLLFGLLPQLEALEAKCAPLMSTEHSPNEPEEIIEEVTLAEDCQLECSSLESGLQALDDGAGLWFNARDGDQSASTDSVDGGLQGAEDSQSEDEDDVDQEKRDLNDRWKKMKDFLSGKKDDLKSKLSNADKLQSDLDRLEKWLEPKEKQRPDMKPGAVRNKPLDEQFLEAEEFAKELSDFQPEVDSLAASLPPAPTANGAVANGDVNSLSHPAEAPTVAKCRDCLQRFEDLKTDASNRLDMLEELKPKIDKVESGLTEVNGDVKDWEAWAENIKIMDTTKVEVLRKQAEEIQSLKAKLAALEKAKWSEVQSDCRHVLDYHVGPFGEVVSPQPTTGEANGDSHQPPTSPAASKKKKSKSKNKGAKGKGTAATNGGQV